MSAVNEHLIVARMASHFCGVMTAFNAAVAAMEKSNMERSDYNIFMVGRYVGEMIAQHDQGLRGSVEYPAHVTEMGRSVVQSEE